MGSPILAINEKSSEQITPFSLTIGIQNVLVINFLYSPGKAPRYDIEPTANKISPNKFVISIYSLLVDSDHLIFSPASPCVKCRARTI